MKTLRLAELEVSIKIPKSLIHKLTMSLNELHRGNKVYYPALDIGKSYNPSCPILWDYSKLNKSRSEAFSSGAQAISIEYAIEVGKTKIAEMENMIKRFKEVVEEIQDPHLAYNRMTE